MENMNVKTMSAEALEETRKSLYMKIEALPNRFNLNGYEFTWREQNDFGFENGEFVNYPCLRISSTNHRDFDCNYDIRTNGDVKYYSFSSNGGKDTAEATKSMNYFNTCAALLSDDFRQTIIRDYNEKLEDFTNLKAEYEAISNEQTRRHDEEKALKESTLAELKKQRRYMVEAFGYVWFDYSWRSVKYTVKETTDKTILFNIWSYSIAEEKWVHFDTKRISKHLLGQKPSRRYKDNPKVMICPLANTDFDFRSNETPETLEY